MTTIKSAAITQRDTAPNWPFYPGSGGTHATPKVTIATSAKTSAHLAADIWRMARVWTGWTITELLLETDAWGTSGAVDVGCYDINDGAVIDADVFGSAVSVASALAPTDVCCEATTIDARVSPLRTRLAMAATDVDKWVDIALTATHIGAAQAAKFNLTAKHIGNES